MIFFDAARLIEEITDPSRRKRLTAKLDYFNKLQWSKLDLSTAKTIVELIKKREDASGFGNLPNDELIIDGALASRAYILYHEATTKIDPRDALNEEQKKRHLELGSGLVAHSQKMTVAASATAEKKAVGQRS